jgi:hypothetical protein
VARRPKLVPTDEPETEPGVDQNMAHIDSDVTRIAAANRTVPMRKPGGKA